MINPKQQLTQIRDIYFFKDHPEVLDVAGLSGGLSASMAAADAVQDSEIDQFVRLQDYFSISTVEEVAELARRDQLQGSTFLQDAGLSPDIGQRLLDMLLGSPGGDDEIQDWERYGRLVYETGYEIDLDAEPVLPLQPPVTGPAAALGTPAASPVTNVSMIGPHMPPIRDQVKRSTCVAFTAMACLEFYQARFGTHAGLDLSEQFAYWDMVSRAGQRNLQSAFPLLTTSGSCLEVTWPYVPYPFPGNDRQDPPPPTAGSEAAAYTCSRVRQLAPRDVEAIKRALSKERIVGIGIPVYKSWSESPVVRKYGNITVPIPGEVPEPVGHAFCLVGYADDPQYSGGGYFIVRNSWGFNWGTVSPLGVGYGSIPYRYISNFNWDAWCVIA